MAFNPIEELIDDLKNGKMVILVDDEDRENEGDLVLAADHVTPQAINFMAMQARGLICLALSPQQIEKLQLPLMVREDMNLTPNKTAFTVSIEASYGVSTGISAADRAHTVRVASNPMAKPADVHMPGHVFPIRAQHGGVLKRAGHTEGSIDLAKMAGLNPAAVICEVMNEDGTMARVPDLKKFAQAHNLKIGTIVELIQYRLQHETLIEEVYAADLPPEYGDFKVRVFKSKLDGMEHLVLQKGEIPKDKPVLARVQVDNYVKDLFATLNYQSNALEASLQMIDQEGEGVVILLRGNNRVNLCGDIKTLTQPEEVGRAFLMDEKDYGIGAQILRALGIHKIRLLTNKPEKRTGIKAFELEIVEVVALDVVRRWQGDKDEEKQSQNRSGHKSLQ
jgi:3,4-dihydroxy 2-butanone 4-phosphate synthase/GTP cyclohydrolase II